MVSQDSTPNPASNILHQFIISDSIASRNQFENQHFEAYRNELRGSSSGLYPPQSLGVLPSIQSLGERVSRSIDLVHQTQESEMNHSGHLMDLLGASNDQANHHAQRLSLSLDSPHMLIPPSVQYRQRSLNSNLISPNYLFGGEQARENGDYSFASDPFAASSTSANQSCSTSYGAEAFAIAVGSSKYLKPAQSLLEESVNVGGKAVDLSNEKYVRRLSCSSRRGSLGLCSELKAELCNNGLSADKHEFQVTIAKLIGLLEEVERSYEQYHNHLEEVVASFEVIAGLGAGKSYTALALQAMSRHFCSLRDAIISQINAAKRKAAQDLPNISTDLSQLGLFDRDNRHNRLFFQQIGMSQSQRQAWRPIRGLPETSVAILRAWLFEHFLHPYPNDTEKLMLASQTGLTKNQVSNWFINARVRLWKPMIEEMYKEEFADSSADSNPLLASCSFTGEGITDDAEE
ncbi:BEL1-like homeodomain protein 11 [Cornus florida]|uniref:BEL1-like homeodomain protein 11 n=1 Tax=Cornus florida TaxID=4283 RepID=UPI0028A29960|nr:BEL1-like homeodomain protein 11 [Cornus florida]